MCIGLKFNVLGVYSSSAVAQLREDMGAITSLRKFMWTITGYAGGESTSHIVRRRPCPPSLSSMPETSTPDASSTAMYLPPGRTFARLSICARESGRMSRGRFWSLLNQYSHTLNIVGSRTEKYLENLTKGQTTGRSWGGEGDQTTHLASFLFLYFSLLYSVLSE